MCFYFTLNAVVKTALCENELVFLRKTQLTNDVQVTAQDQGAPTKKIRLTVDFSGASDYGAVWCVNDLRLAMNENPLGAYRTVIYNWVNLRGGSSEDSSLAVKNTRLCYLKETEVGKKGKWSPNKQNPTNKCKRWVYYLWLARQLGWTERRVVLGESDGHGGSADGFSHLVHLAVNHMWPGDEHDPPIPYKRMDPLLEIYGLVASL